MNNLSAPRAEVRTVVTRALAEDLSSLGDITSSLIPPGAPGSGAIVTKGEGMLAGTECVAEVLAQVDPELSIVWEAQDGVELSADQVVARVAGPLESLLTAEHCAMTLLTHLSGVATLTRRYVRAGQNKVRVREGFNTTPGLGALQRAAVRAGGGVNDRSSLSDCIALSSRHLAAISITDAVRRAHMRWPGRAVEVNCRTLSQVDEALSAGVDIVSVDIGSLDIVAAFVEEVHGRCLVEAQGNIELAMMSALVAAGVDLASVTSLVAGAPLEMALELERR